MEWELKVTLFQIQGRYTWLAVLWPSSRNKLLTTELGFHGNSDSRESICNAGGPSLIPVLGRSLGEGIGYPLQYFCLGNPMDRGAWWVTVHGVARESDIPAWENHLRVGICDICSRLPILNFITDSLSLVSEIVSATKAFCSVNGGFYFQFQGFCLCNLQCWIHCSIKSSAYYKKKKKRHSQTWLSD